MHFWRQEEWVEKSTCEIGDFVKFETRCHNKETQLVANLDTRTGDKDPQVSGTPLLWSHKLRYVSEVLEYLRMSVWVLTCPVSVSSRFHL